MWNLFVAINSDKSAKIANLLQSVANLLLSTYTEIHNKTSLAHIQSPTRALFAVSLSLSASVWRQVAFVVEIDHP